MVDERRDAAIGVILRVLWALVLLLGEIEVLRLEGQAQLCEGEGRLPADTALVSVRLGSTSSKHTIR